MICYRDMTFCNHHIDCAHGGDCHRALTDDVARAAEAAGLMMSMYADKPECYKAKTEPEA